MREDYLWYLRKNSNFLSLGSRTSTQPTMKNDSHLERQSKIKKLMVFKDWRQVIQKMRSIYIHGFAKCRRIFFIFSREIINLLTNFPIKKSEIKLKWFIARTNIKFISMFHSFHYSPRLGKIFLWQQATFRHSPPWPVNGYGQVASFTTSLPLKKFLLGRDDYWLEAWRNLIETPPTPPHIVW